MKHRSPSETGEWQPDNGYIPVGFRFRWILWLCHIFRGIFGYQKWFLRFRSFLRPLHLSHRADCPQYDPENSILKNP